MLKISRVKTLVGHLKKISATTGLKTMEEEYAYKAFISYSHEGPGGALAFRRDGRYVASGGYDETLRFWTLDTADRRSGRFTIDTGQDVYAVEFDQSASRVAAATEDGSVLIWQLNANGASGPVVGTHLLQSDGMTGLAFGPQDRFLVSSSLE